MSAYPDWVKKFRTKGTAIKKVGHSYYLYKHTSKRVPGKKYPQAVDKYIGTITPDGLIIKNKRKVSLEDIEVLEYGFSYTLLSICPDKWKKNLNDDWLDVLKIIISNLSPRSYLLADGYALPDNRNIDYQKKKLFQLTDIPLDQLLSLASIYLLKFEDRDVISRITDEQRKLLMQLNIEIAGVSG